MTTDTDKLDQAEEIHFTEDQFTDWFSQSTSRPDILHVEGMTLLLKNHAEPVDYPRRSELSLMVERAFGKPEPERQDAPTVWRLTRHADAVWTLFRTSYGVIAVNDDGNVAVWFTAITMEDWKIRITPRGTMACYGERPYPEYIIMRQLCRTIQRVESDIKDWARRGHGRRKLPGIKRLLKNIAETPDPPFGKDADTGAWCYWPDEACHVM